MEKTILGLFDSYLRAGRAIDMLERAGFEADEISVVARSDVVEEHLDFEATKDALKGAGVGMTGGALFGGLVGLLTGVAAVILPGVGSVIAAGTLGTLLGGAAMGAGIAGGFGGLAGALIGLGLSEEEAHLYVEGVKQGHLLVAVKAEQGQVWKAQNALHQTQALKVTTWPGKWQAGPNLLESDSPPKQ